MEREIRERLARVRAELAAAAERAGRDASEILLVAATKTQSDETIRAAVAAGVTACGENRAQELLRHLEGNAYDGAAVHFIGHLQRNKVRQLVGRAALIQSVDSEELLLLIDKYAAAMGITQDILLQVNVAGEASKSGVAPEETARLSVLARSLSSVRLCGLMTVAPIAAAPGANRPFFRAMRQLFIDIREKTYDNNNKWYLSMGMSEDFADAVAEGANLVRIGTALFGPRQGADAALSRD